jgi:anaphase-promoting complex subunit 7
VNGQHYIFFLVSEESPEPWIAMGYYCYVSKKGNRSLFFAHKACMLDRRSVEALLLKGNILLDMKKLQDAMNHFREAVVLAPHRYETHKVQKDQFKCHYLVICT